MARPLLRERDVLVRWRARSYENACGRRHLDVRWSFLWGYETCEGAPKWVARAHAGRAIATFGGVPDWAAKRVMDVPKFVARTHARGTAAWDLRWGSRWAGPYAVVGIAVAVADGPRQAASFVRWVAAVTPRGGGRKGEEDDEENDDEEEEEEDD